MKVRAGGLSTFPQLLNNCRNSERRKRGSDASAHMLLCVVCLFIVIDWLSFIVSFLSLLMPVQNLFALQRFMRYFRRRGEIATSFSGDDSEDESQQSLLAALKLLYDHKHPCEEWLNSPNHHRLCEMNVLYPSDISDMQVCSCLYDSCMWSPFRHTHSFFISLVFVLPLVSCW